MAKLHLYYKKNPLQFLQLTGLNVVVNNETTIKIGNWKEVVVEVNAGKVVVQMSMPYLGGEVGTARVEFEIKENDDFMLIYKSPIVVMAPGTILVQKM